MTYLSIKEVESLVRQYAGRIGQSESVCLPNFGFSKDMGYPHIEVDRNGYHYVVVERGEEQSRFTTNDINRLLCHVFEEFTWSLAVGYEQEHRTSEYQDSRRESFRRQLEMLGAISPEFMKASKRRQEEVLKKRPYDDFSVIRARLAKELRQSGLPSELAWKKACAKYPRVSL